VPSKYKRTRDAGIFTSAARMEEMRKLKVLDVLCYRQAFRQLFRMPDPKDWSKGDS
jgi:hypothetical protein